MRLRVGAFLAWALLCVVSRGCLVYLPDERVLDTRLDPPDTHENEIERQTVCVGSLVESSGDLGKELYYRSARTADGKLAVGYYAFFSEERPWGNNWLTWTVLPALAVDLFYTRFLLVAPGIQRLEYGKGDVEGFRVVYDRNDRGELSAEYAIADDSTHTDQRLSRSDLFATDPHRLTVYADAWSHQLAGRGARSMEDLAYVRCYGPGSIRPLTQAITDDFRLAGRASPAGVGPGAPAESPAIVAESREDEPDITN